MRKQNSWTMIAAAAWVAFAVGEATAQVDDLGVEGAVRGAAPATPGRVSGPVDAAERRAGVDQPSDAEILVGVQTALAKELEIKGVRSEVIDGVATLQGTVDTEAQKERAERIARRVDGVTRVRNELTVRAEN
jgi:hypothetical protein